MYSRPDETFRTSIWAATQLAAGGYASASTALGAPDTMH